MNCVGDNFLKEYYPSLLTELGSVSTHANTPGTVEHEARLGLQRG